MDQGDQKTDHKKAVKNIDNKWQKWKEFRVKQISDQILSWRAYEDGSKL